MNKVTVNNRYQFEVDVLNGALKVNHQDLHLDVLTLTAESSHIIHDNKSYNVEVVDFNKEEKHANIKINGHVYKVQITTQLDMLLQQLGMDSLANNKVLMLKAPMPGLVLNVMVAVGDEVKKGDSLLVLEAMKMENIIKSPADAVVKKIGVKQGDKIEKNTVLIEFV